MPHPPVGGRLLDPDTHLQRACADVVDAGLADDVPRHLRRGADHHVVDGGGHHFPFRVEAPHVGESRVPGDDVEHLQQQPEAEIAGDVVFHHLVLAAQRRIPGKGERVDIGGIEGPDHEWPPAR